MQRLGGRNKLVIGAVALLIILYYVATYPRIQPFTQDPAQREYAQRTGTALATTNSVGMVLRLIPPGLYQRGSPETERGRRENEFPHPVRIYAPFYLSATEVTQGQFDAVMAYNPSFFDGNPERPVEFVSWEEAIRFCNELGKREGLDAVYEQEDGRWIYHPDRHGYRLPTEAEWEFACRAGTSTPYHTGPARPVPLGRDNVWRAAWYRFNAKGATRPVGQREPNGWGLYDMHGNVWEWCWDWYGPYPRVLDPKLTGPDRGRERVIRGGGWYSASREVRSAYRTGRAPDAPWNSLGFRVARTLP